MSLDWPRTEPADLLRLLDRVTYKEGWAFRVDHRFGVLEIRIRTSNSLNPQDLVDVRHTFPVPGIEPPMGWDRWLLSRIILVETHEACEFFSVCKEKPFFPDHDGDPYAVVRKEKP